LRKDNLDKLKDEELVSILQKNFNNSSLEFEVLFKRCTKRLYTFLTRKGYSKYDSEDILQDYFGSYGGDDIYSHFEKAIMSFDSSYGGRFINYIKRILLLRLISKKYHDDKEKSIIGGSINQVVGDDSTEIIDFIGKEYNDINEIFLEEIRRIIVSHIFSIDNENHKLAVICRLCLPFKITVSEISEILEINERTLSTYIYRGIDELANIVDGDNRLKNLSYENDISKFIERRLLHIKKDTIDETFSDPNTRKIFDFLFYQGKNIEEISEELCIDIIELKKKIKNGIMKLISDRKYLLK
jgi:hypothetical protein